MSILNRRNALAEANHLMTQAWHYLHDADAAHVDHDEDIWEAKTNLEKARTSAKKSLDTANSQLPKQTR